ncbi:MAG TPA: T9SS type A sorting domain-containing protein, partial [Saprospiraceae bacterium]|nr:T9SS type A sorting domain-containing protein [Saprospiraceae bacterium]
LGRINEIAFGPSNSNTIYVGTPAAGLWKSTDGGSNWASNTDNLPSLGVSAIVVDKDDANTIYIGTGDRDGNDSAGKGVMKSTDGGNTFTAINSGILSYEYINDLIQDPNNGDVMIAAGYFKSIYRTSNGGASWSTVSNPSPSDAVLSLAFKPGNSQIVYASTRYGKFYRSTDNGQNWSQITSGFPNLTSSGTHRAFIAVSAAAPNDVYVVRADGRPFEGLYRSTDNGASFSKQSGSPNLLGYYDGTGSDATSGQGWYDLTIVADPTTAGTIYVGGVNIWKSTNNGASWTKKTSWTSDVHADQHHLAFGPNGYCYAGNDGGLYYSSDGWDSETEISSGLSIAQLYKIGQSRNTADLTLAGFQDNGTGLRDGNSWSTVVGGDGMECAIDPTNDSYKYMALYYGDIRRSVNGGWFSIASSLEDGPWVTPYKINPTDPNMILSGRNTKLWRTTNAKAASTGDVSWTGVTSTLDDGLDVEVSPVDGKICYYSTTNDHLYRTDDITASSPTWVEVSLPLNNQSVNDIVAHPTALNTVYITLGTHVYKSTNKGGTWTDYTHNFPDLKPFCLAYDKTTNEGIYAGTPAGIYYLEPGTNNWTSFSTNLPVNVDSRELEIYYDDVNPSNNLIRVATYGRGMWSSPLASAPLPVSLISFSGKKISHHAIALNWTTSSEINNEEFIIQRSMDGVHFRPIGHVKGAGQSSTPKSYAFLDNNPGAGINYYRLVQKDFDGVKTHHHIVAVSFSVDGYQGVEVYPNPNKGIFTVFINQQYTGLFDLAVYNQTGQLVISEKQVSNGRHPLDLTGLPKGLYYLEVKNKDVLNTQKIFVE